MGLFQLFSGTIEVEGGFAILSWKRAKPAFFDKKRTQIDLFWPQKWPFYLKTTFNRVTGQIESTDVWLIVLKQTTCNDFCTFPSLHHWNHPAFCSNHAPNFWSEHHETVWQPPIYNSPLVGYSNWTNRTSRHALVYYSAFKNVGPTNSIWSFLEIFRIIFGQMPSGNRNFQNCPINRARRASRQGNFENFDFRRVFGRKLFWKSPKMTKFRSRTNIF